MMAKLMSPILLFLCPLLLQSVSKAVASPYPTYPITKSSNCKSQCGNITIHFPFGIGANCFLDEWYEILCVNDRVPRLRKLNLQVLDIFLSLNGRFSSENTITVNYPIFYSSSSSCVPTHSGKSEPVNFSGSPFLLSSANNFLSVGCESVAKLTYGGQSFVGCSTECNGNKTRRYSSCDDGLDCCWSMVPDGIQGFSVDFLEKKSLGTSGGDHDCQFALLVNSTWLEPDSTVDLYAIRNGGCVPVVLEWGILDASFPASIGLNSSSKYYNYYDSPQHAAQCSNWSTSNMNTTTFINCFCIRGFYGNPYVEDGCKDINECEYYPSLYPSLYGTNICGGGLHKCRNTRGSYQCVKTTLFIIIGLCSSFGSLLMIFLAWWTYKQIKKRREAKLRAKLFKRNGGLILQQQLSAPKGNVEKGRLFNYKELEAATDHFNKNRILGKGGQGTVYKGMMTDGRIVAIKKSIAIDEENVEPFINEVVI